MDWMRQEDNPYFARAFVNRVWAGYFGVGIIDPPDDLNLANPPSNPALLDYLADGFVEQRLRHEVAAPRDRQQPHLSAELAAERDEPARRAELQPGGRSAGCRPRWPTTRCVSPPPPTTPQKLLHARPGRHRRAIGVASGFSPATATAAPTPSTCSASRPRAINCDCERSNEPSLLQTVYLRNDQEVLNLLDRKDGWLKQVGQGQGARRRRAGDRRRTCGRSADCPTTASVSVARKHLTGRRRRPGCAICSGRC